YGDMVDITSHGKSRGDRQKKNRGHGDARHVGPKISVLVHRSLRSQLIEQCRNGIRKKQESCGDGGGENPVKPRQAKRPRVEAAEHLRPEVALKFGVLQRRELALEKCLEFLFVFLSFAIHVFAHFAATSKPRGLSFFRSIRTARKTRTFTSATEMPTASPISL